MTSHTTAVNGHPGKHQSNRRLRPRHESPYDPRIHDQRDEEADTPSHPAIKHAQNGKTRKGKPKRPAGSESKNGRPFRASRDENETDGPSPAPEFVGSPFQLTLGHQQPGIFAPEWVIQITTTKAELLVLAQLVYWFGESRRSQKLRAKIEREGHWWVAKTYRKFGKEIHISKDQVRRAIRSLTKRGIVVADHAAPGELVCYRLDPTRIETVLADLEVASVADEEGDGNE